MTAPFRSGLVVIKPCLMLIVYLAGRSLVHNISTLWHLCASFCRFARIYCSLDCPTHRGTHLCKLRVQGLTAVTHCWQFPYSFGWATLTLIMSSQLPAAEIFSCAALSLVVQFSSRWQLVLANWNRALKSSSDKLCDIVCRGTAILFQLTLSPLFLHTPGIFYTMAIIGPALGYILGGQFLKIYSDISVDASA